jgi:hypothetical protein
MSKAFGEIGDCSRSDNVNALDTTVRPVARTLAPALSEGRSASAPATASSDAYLSSASRRPVLLDSHPKNPLLVLALCLRPPDQTCTTSLRRETHSCCPYWSPVNQRSRVSIAFLHHVGTPSSTLKSNPTANAGLSKPAPALRTCLMAASKYRQSLGHRDPTPSQAFLDSVGSYLNRILAIIPLSSWFSR